MGNTILTTTILDCITRSRTLCKGKLKRTDKVPFVALYQAGSRSETGKNSSASLANEQCLWFHYPETFQFHTRVPAHFKFLRHALLTGFLHLHFPLMEEISDDRKDTVYPTWNLNTRMWDGGGRWCSCINYKYPEENHTSPLRWQDSHPDPLISKLADSSAAAAGRITSRAE